MTLDGKPLGSSSSDSEAVKLVEERLKAINSIIEEVDYDEMLDKELELITNQLAQQDPVAFKKINSDLKRQVEKKLEKLKKKTQRSIVEILRERLASEAKEEDEE